MTEVAAKHLASALRMLAHSARPVRPARNIPL
jgi:hypothetical protein